MNNTISEANKSKLFFASCLALVVTAMTFAIRAGILTQLNQQLGLTDAELGWINAMAFLGFPVATVIGGVLYNIWGARNLIIIAFVTHLLGLLLTIYADGFSLLLLSSFCIGFANGSVEAGCNPLIAGMYNKDKTVMLNRFHVWFPGGIVIGALISMWMTGMGLAWEWQIGVILLPTLLYGAVVLNQEFPVFEKEETSTLTNFKAMATPLFLFMAVCMSLTATTELGTQQWIERILRESGAAPMLIMAMITGVMAVGRFFAGPVVHRLNPTGVLLSSAVLATIGIYSMSLATGAMVYVAALLFALGVTYFWPTMLAYVAENIPKSGAPGMSVIGGIGMLAVSIWNPVIGVWLDDARIVAREITRDPQQIELIAGQMALSNLALFPTVLILAFTGLFFYQKKQQRQFVASQSTVGQEG